MTGALPASLSSAADPAPTGPAVRRLTLSAFRNYAGLQLDLDRSPVVLSGPNGAGKTNILEALSFLAPGRGLRRARLSDIDMLPARPGTGWAVAARIEALSDMWPNLVPPEELPQRAARRYGAAAEVEILGLDLAEH